MARKTKLSRPVNLVDEALMNIYKDTDGSVPNLTSFERRRRRLVHPLLWGVILLFLVVAGASAVSFYYFAPMIQAPEGKTVQLIIEGPKEAVSGAKVTYILTYVNEERVALNDVELRLTPSSGFTIDQASPKATKNGNVWKLGRLESKGSGSIELIGTAVGTSEKGVTLDALLTYTRDNFSSSLQERTSVQTSLTPALLTVTLDNPDQIVIGEESQLSATIKNAAEIPATNVALFIQLPLGATVKNLPKHAREEKVSGTDGGTAQQSLVRFTIGAIGPGDEVTEKISMILPQVVQASLSTTPAIAEVKAEAGFLLRDEFFPQSSASASAEIVEGGVLARLAVNGVAGKGTIGWDDALTATVNYENRGKVAAENMEIRVNVTGDAIDWTTLSDPKKGIVSSQGGSASGGKNGEIRWSKREIPGLALVKAGATGTITFSIRLRAPEDEALKGGAKDARIHVEGTALIGKIGKKTKDAVVAMTPVDLDVNSDLSFRAETRYFSEENIPYGTGPLPPRVGEATTYRVFMKVKNSLHELRAIEARAVLPLFVAWTGKTVVSAGEMKYDPLTREVRWTLNRMPTSVESLETQFEVRFTPLPEHAKTTVILVPEIVLTADDGATGGKLQRSQGPFTTAIPDDPEAKGKGVVVE